MAYTVTPNIPLNMPTPGTREPAQIALLNENCVQLSNHDHTNGKALAVGRLRSGLNANRPAAGTAGNVYFATDTGNFYVDTGTAWVQFITSGGQATVTGWTLIDPVVRDTIQWGPEGSSAIDGALSRTSAGVLKWINGAGGAQFWIDGKAASDDALGLMFSKGGSNRWLHQVTGDTSDSPYILYDYGRDGSLFLERIRVTHDTDAQLGNIMFQGGSPTNRSYLNLRFRPGTRSWVEIKSEQSSGLMRLGQPVGGATNAGFWVTSNCDFDGASWQRDDTTKAAWNVSGTGTGLFAIYHAKAGANPIGTFLSRFQIDSNGTATFTPDAGQKAITAQSDIILNGTVQCQVGGAENLSGMWYHTAVGARQGFCGLDSADLGVWRIYGNIGTAGNRMTVNLTTGKIVIAGPATTADPFLVCNGGALNFYQNSINGRVHAGAGSLEIGAASGFIHSSGADGTTNMGHPSLRWNTFYAINGAINTSHVSMKENFAPLDPAACVEAVLGTDWLAFDYKRQGPPPPQPAPLPATEGETDAQRAEREANDATAQRFYEEGLAASEAARHQKGYVLGSPDHRVSDLFGVSDRKSASPGSDLAVVACALQSALRRIAELEAKNATAA